MDERISIYRSDLRGNEYPDPIIEAGSELGVPWLHVPDFKDRSSDDPMVADYMNMLAMANFEYPNEIDAYQAELRRCLDANAMMWPNERKHGIGGLYYALEVLDADANCMLRVKTLRSGLVWSVEHPSTCGADMATDYPFDVLKWLYWAGGLLTDAWKLAYHMRIAASNTHTLMDAGIGYHGQ